MTEELELGRKWTLRAHGRQGVFVKRPVESREHVLMKALLWALYLPLFPDLSVEIRVGQRYKPDVVALDGSGTPTFWGEAGHVGAHKLQTLLRRFRTTHFAFARWGTSLASLGSFVQPALADTRQAPVDLIVFAEDTVERCISERGEISVRFEELDWLRL